MSKTIVTHNQNFHCDEVVAFTILDYLIDNPLLLRTRNKIPIEKADFVIDVGFKYDPKNNRFDHHQDGFNEFFHENGFVPMSSAGLVWKEYGKKFIKKYDNTLQKNEIDFLYTSFYEKFILEIDAHDNGVRQCEYEAKHKYRNQTVLGCLISDMNGINIEDNKEQLRNFKKASSFALEAMKIKLDFIIKKLKSYDKDKNTINNAFKKSFNDGQILYITENCTNWIKCIHEYEKRNKMKGVVKFIICKINEEYKIKTIEKKRFEPRKKIKPLSYLKRNIKNSDDIIFVHKLLFLAATKTFDAALEICEMSL